MASDSTSIADLPGGNNAEQQNRVVLEKTEIQNGNYKFPQIEALLKSILYMTTLPLSNEEDDLYQQQTQLLLPKQVQQYDI